MLKVKTTVTGLGQTWEVNGSKCGLDPSEEYLCFIFDGYVGASFPDSAGLCFLVFFFTGLVTVQIKFIIKITNAAWFLLYACSGKCNDLMTQKRFNSLNNI